MRKFGLKGYRVTHHANGKTTLERIPFYGLDSSSKIRKKKSKKVKPVSVGFAGLFGKGRGTSAK